MHFYAFCTVVSLVGFATVLAIPLGGLQALSPLSGLTSGSIGSSGSLPAANSLGGLSQLTGIGNVASLGGLLSGVDDKRQSIRAESHPEYIESSQVNVSGSCNVGTAQCCQSLHQTSEFSRQFAGGLLSALLPLDDLMVGIQCSPIANVLPILSGGSSCQSKPVCCSGNTYEGLINIGCSPISL